jgi:hypothetical protein
MLQTAIFGLLAICTGYVGFEAVIAFRSYQRGRFWRFVLIAIPLTVVTCFAMWEWLSSPMVTNYNVGFSGDMDCTNPGRGGPICVRKPPVNQTKPVGSN